MERPSFSPHSFKDVLMSHTFGDMTSIFREGNSELYFLATVRFECERLGFRGNQAQII